MSDEIEVLNAEAELGVETEKFLTGNVGRYLIGCAELEEKDAVDALLDFDPYKYTTLGEIQSAFAKIKQTILTSRNVQGYLSDAIIRGRQAEEVLTNIEDD